MSTIWIVDGAPALAETVRRTAEARGAAARCVDGAAPPAVAAGDAVLDLGAPPASWGEDVEAEETARTRRLAAGLPRGARVVRASLLGAAPDAPAALQRAHHAAECAWEEAGADLVRLRHGLVLGRFGLHAGWRRLVERWPLLFVPAFDIRFEPILDADLAEYCVQASDPARRFDATYDLGCGDLATNGFYVRALAAELGRSPVIVPAPALLRGPVARALAGDDLPFPAAWLMLEVLSRTLLPRRMNAWNDFDVRPADLTDSVTRSLGRVRVEPPRKADEPFSAWTRPKKKRPKPFLR